MTHQPYQPYEPQPGRPEPAPPDASWLGEAPRPVPLAYRFGAIALGPIELFVLLMLAVGPMALWLLVPSARIVALAIGIGYLVVRCGALYRRRVGTLRHGEVATVGDVERTATATSYENVPLRTARGWRSRWQTYSGSGYRSEIQFVVGGRPGTLVIRGLPYDGGVVLADPRDPSRALCISQLPFPVEPDTDGRYRGGLPWPAWLCALVTLGIGAVFVLCTVLEVRSWF